MYCQIETLRRCFPASIRRTLDELPETLDGTYEQTLQGIDKQKRDYAYRLLQCLVISKRPLRVEELAELFAIRHNVETTPTFDASLRPENPEEFVLSACSTLVTVVNQYRQKVVQFSHFSVREYLTSHRIAISNVSRFHILPRPAHALLATSCLSVLLHLDVRVDENDIRNFPLASYAAQYWVDHAQFEDVSSDIKYEMKCLFDKSKPHFVNWLQIYNMDNPGSTPRHSAPYPVPLYYAALCGFGDIAKHLLDVHPQDINARGGELVTPLYAALEMGHPSAAMPPVEHGADMESRNSGSRTLLDMASYRGHNEIATLLIGRGADLNAKSNLGETLLYLALKRRRNDIARYLLYHGADVDCPDNHGKTLLHLAFETGHYDIFRYLLDHGADVNLPDNRGKTPLHLAFETGRYDIFRYLLDHGADANHPDNRGLTPLHLASQSGHIEMVHLLLDYGAEINRRDSRSLSPLHHASMGGLNGTVQALLDQGADANLPGNRGLTALHYASLRGLNDTIRLLLDHGADTNRQDNRGRTALHYASLRGLSDIVQ